jgi:sugar lactone lactonase YvrE
MSKRALCRVMVLVGVVTTVLLLSGCAPPTANAGPDQVVPGGAGVVLDGTGSFTAFPPLTYLWQQIAGVPVVLSDPQSVTPTFVAPDLPAVLTFELTVTDGLGASAFDTTVVTVGTPPPTPTATLYVANSLGNNVTAYGIRFPTTFGGDLSPLADLAGLQTQLNAPSALVIDNSGALLVNSAATPSVTGYANALDLAALNGDTAPNRVVQGPATGLIGSATMVLDASDDLLFVAETQAGFINVYANASTGLFDDDVAPVSTITGPYVPLPRGMSLAEGDELYVANGPDVNDVVVLAPASTLAGDVIATRVIESPAFTDVVDVFIDDNDTMYVVNGVGGGNQVNIFDNAGVLDGTYFPDATLTVAGAVSISAITVDSTGNGYIADPGANAIYGYSAIATRSGPLPPDAVLQGPNTGLAGPVRMSLEQVP